MRGREQVELAHHQRRRTKIVCTVGPATDKAEILTKLAQAGMNVARLNMSHGDHKSHLQVVRTIKALNRKLQHPIAILMDLQGPEIRTGELTDSLDLEKGEEVYVAVIADDAEERSVHVDYADLVQHLHAGDQVTVDNGLINLEILQVEEHRLRCRILDGGTLGSRKHVNLPGIRVNLPSITEKDRHDIDFAIKNDLDFIALSFVRSADDLLHVREIVEKADGHQRLIAKIENHEGVENFDAILDATDVVMIARGDLGVEIPFEELPALQRHLVRKCAIAGKPVIVATHLLESMIENPMPTRAEVTDVANAVYEQVDAVMLSGETAVGRNPERCVQTLHKIASATERESGLAFYEDRPAPQTQREHLARSACRLADSIGAGAILVITRRGSFGELVASYRPQSALIYAFTNMSTTRRKLWLTRSIVASRIRLSQDPEKTIDAGMKKLREMGAVKPGDEVVIVSDFATTSGALVTGIQLRHLE